MLSHLSRRSCRDRAGMEHLTLTPTHLPEFPRALLRKQGLIEQLGLELCPGRRSSRGEQEDRQPSGSLGGVGESRCADRSSAPRRVPRGPRLRQGRGDRASSAAADDRRRDRRDPRQPSRPSRFGFAGSGSASARAWQPPEPPTSLRALAAGRADPRPTSRGSGASGRRRGSLTTPLARSQGAGSGVLPAWRSTTPTRLAYVERSPRRAEGPASAAAVFRSPTLGRLVRRARRPRSSRVMTEQRLALHLDDPRRRLPRTRPAALFAPRPYRPRPTASAERFHPDDACVNGLTGGSFSSSAERRVDSSLLARPLQLPQTTRLPRPPTARNSARRASGTTWLGATASRQPRAPATGRAAVRNGVMSPPAPPARASTAHRGSCARAGRPRSGARVRRRR